MNSETPPLPDATPPPDSAPPPPPASPALETTHSARQVSKFDRTAVSREMAEKGFFTLPAGTNVLLNVVAAPKLQRSLGGVKTLGIGTSQAPVECFVQVNGEPINPDDPDTTWARLDLTSAELRRLQCETAQVNTQLEALLPKSDERETLSTLIGQSAKPYQAEELVQEQQRLADLQAQERQRLAGVLLEANPDFQKLVDNQLKGHFNVTGANLHVGITTPPGDKKFGPP